MLQENKLKLVPLRYPLGMACLALLSAAPVVFAQTPPNAGTLSQDPPRESLNLLPKADGPSVAAQRARRAFVTNELQIRPADFKFSGNTIFGTEVLLAEIADSRGKELSFDALADLAEKVKGFYVARGYPLTDLYFPEQSFQKEGGVVEFVVIEARIGTWSVTVAENASVSRSQVESIIGAHYRRGAVIDQYMLDKPILLLRDMTGVEASATVRPGKEAGEADVAVEVKRVGRSWDFSTSFDNAGFRSTGEYRVGVNVGVNHPFNVGDQLTFRAQPNNVDGNVLYRIGYSVPVGPYATKLIGGYSDTRYKLGFPFEALSVSGSSQIASLSVVQPLIRGRLSNMVALLGADQKRLTDLSGTGVTKTEIDTKTSSVRLGLLGTTTDVLLGGGNTTYSAIVTGGRVAVNGSTVGDTLGTFSRLNFDVQRTQFYSPSVALSIGLIGQLASGNLQSAERISYGGPSGVRGYAVATGNGDQGLLLTAEWRYLTGVEVMGSRLTALAFYDIARVQDKKFPLAGRTNPKLATFDSLGIGFKVGTEGKFVASGSIAQRIGGPYPIGSDPTPGAQFVVRERSPQLWVAANWWY